MKTVLSICIAALLLSACGSDSANNETVTNPTGISAPINNPAHGMPGHDCAVEVGAPLPQKGSTPSLPTENIPAPAPVEMNKAVKLNPAHGQPDHRCDIAVGAPLG